MSPIGFRGHDFLRLVRLGYPVVLLEGAPSIFGKFGSMAKIMKNQEVKKKATAGQTETKKVPAPKVAAEKSRKAVKLNGKDLFDEPDSGPLPEDELVGKKAPDFELMDQRGKKVTSGSFKGKAYVLYFYPKDNTPGCTTESCDFRDALGNFGESSLTVVGVSPDSVKSHDGFATKFDLPFTLLSDPEKELAQAYGVWALKKNYGREYWGIVRSTFLIGKNGKVLKAWRGVRVKGHVDAVLSEATSI